MARKIKTYVLGFHLALIFRHFHLVNTSPFGVHVAAEDFTHARLADKSDSDLHTFYHTLEPLEPHPEDAKFRLTTEFSVDSSDMSDEFFIEKLTSPSWNPFSYEFLDLPSLAKLHNSAQKTVGDSDAGEVNMPTKLTTPPGTSIDQVHPIRRYVRKVKTNGPVGEETHSPNDMHDRNENLEEEETTPPGISGSYSSDANREISYQNQHITWGTDFSSSEHKLKDMLRESKFDGLFDLTNSWKGAIHSNTYTQYEETLGKKMKALDEIKLPFWRASRDKLPALPIAVIPELPEQNDAIGKRRFFIVLIKHDTKSKKHRLRDTKPIQTAILKIVEYSIAFHQIAEQNGVWSKLFNSRSESTSEKSFVKWLDKNIFKKTEDSLPIYGVVDIEPRPNSKIAERYSDVQKYLSEILTSNDRPMILEPYKICLTLLYAWYRHVAWQLKTKLVDHNHPGSFWDLISDVKPADEFMIEYARLNKLRAVSSFYS
ncbi:hypothetical protein PCASD_14833 [Puccinia coronata f. sp. avenae]|uniref:Fungal-type protein kinase domain-containing protein n=1 Tax=Puccinia coronata f. sp. avenae TaxID=200324 RepID=A0A2N5TCD0_9BASI|nr:hypothetical protein PCASD_14833 [Puccinia coronata f. sp. avenae]